MIACFLDSGKQTQDISSEAGCHFISLHHLRVYSPWAFEWWLR